MPLELSPGYYDMVGYTARLSTVNSGLPRIDCSLDEICARRNTSPQWLIRRGPQEESNRNRAILLVCSTNPNWSDFQTKEEPLGISYRSFDIVISPAILALGCISDLSNDCPSRKTVYSPQSRCRDKAEAERRIDNLVELKTSFVDHTFSWLKHSFHLLVYQTSQV